MNNIQTKSQVVFSNRNKSQNSTFNHIFRTEVENNNSSSIINTHTQSMGTVNLGKIRCTNLTGYDKLESLRQLKINRVNEVRKTTGSLQIETVDMSKQLNTSFDKDPYDKVQKPFIGDNAVAEFYTHYKNINRIKEENQIHQQEPSAYTAILDKSIQNNLFPSKMGLVKFQGDETKMNISNYQFGDKYIQVLGEGINRLPDIRNFNFNSNRISEIGAQAILQNMNKNVRVLDLSGNNIGKIGCQYLSNILDKRECRIEELNLENNKLGDNNIKTLLNSLNETNLSVKVLNLSRNFISDSSGEILKDFLKKNQYVTEFYLYWNVIKASGGQQVFEGLLENDYIRVFDISWNPLGESRDKSCTSELCEVIIQNKNLVHVDLSNASFSLNECIQIAEALKQNQTIYGIHFQGNYGYIDNFGFLQVDETNTRKQYTEIVGHRIKGVQQTKSNKRVPGEFMRDCCWICEGWVERDLSWVLMQSGFDYKQPAFVFFDFNNFNATYLGKVNREQKLFKLELMVPPDKVYFMYSFKNKEVVSKTIEKTSVKIFQPLKLKIQNFKEFETYQKNINVIVNKVNKNVIGDGYSPMISVLPRPDRPVYTPPTKKIKKDHWSFDKSIFKDYQLDTDELLKKCFEEDWRHCRISKFVKNQEDLQNVKEYLHSQYKYYKASYKYLSAINPVKDIPTIQNFIFQQLVQESTVIDGQLRQQEVDLKFIATNSNSEMQQVKLNPQRGLVRFELNECIVRLAEEKYIKTQVCDSYYSALKRIYDEHLIKIFYNYNKIVNKWRIETYFTEKVDMTLKHYKEQINQIYLKYSVKHVLPGQKRFVSMDEMYDICRDCDIFTDQTVQECDASISYFLAQQTQVDELYQKVHMQQYQIEFYESLSRLADKYSLPKVQKEVQEGDEQETVEMSLKERMEQPLHVKLESLIHRICSKSLGIEMPKPGIWENYESENEEEEEEELELNSLVSKLQRATERISVMKNIGGLSLLQKIQKQVQKEEGENQ